MRFRSARGLMPQMVQAENCVRSLTRSRRFSKPFDGNRSTLRYKNPCSEVDLREPALLLPLALPDSVGDSLEKCASISTCDLISDALEAIKVDAGVCEADLQMMSISMDKQPGESSSDGIDNFGTADQEAEHVIRAQEILAEFASRPHLCRGQCPYDIRDWGNTNEDTMAYWESDDMNFCDISITGYDQADALLEFGDGLLDVDMDNERDQGDFWDEDDLRCDVLAFNVAANAVDDAFEEVCQACVCENGKIEVANNSVSLEVATPSSTNVEDVFAKVHSTFRRALHLGSLSKELERSRWEALQQNLHHTFTEAAKTTALYQAAQEIAETRRQTFNSEPESENLTSPCQSAPRAEASMPTSHSAVTMSHAQKASEKTLRSSRSKRLVFGAVVRAPAIEHKDDHLALGSTIAQTELRQSENSCQERLQVSSPSFNLAPSASSSVKKSILRCSSLSAFVGDRKESRNIKSRMLWDYESKVQAREYRGAFYCTSPERRGSCRSASMSAMAMDLGSMDSAVVPKLSSFSLRSLRSSDGKISYAGVLPMLPASKESAKSIAFAMQMSKTTKWCEGLRSSASAVF